jgi:hypothetical protein
MKTSYWYAALSPSVSAVVALYLFSANGAFSFQPGATPQVLDRVSTPNAFGGFKAPDASRRISYWASTTMSRAFSAGDLRCIKSWGVAPGSNEPAPLALNMFVAFATAAAMMPGFGINSGKRPCAKIWDAC